MTTIVCNKIAMAADRRISDVPMFLTTKIFRVGDSLYGFAGSPAQSLKFLEWRREPDKKPEFSGAADFTVLELSHAGIFYWDDELIRLPVEADFYAIGNGAEYALGALAMGASLKRSIVVASRWDEKTGPEVQMMSLKVK
jgi:ATP-dependent protease HslVU (ClpYQ) peptidase subunit